MYRFDFDKLRKNERWEMSLWKNLEEENGINIQKFFCKCKCKCKCYANFRTLKK